MCCYGEAQTLRALDMGAVEQLFLSANLQTKLSMDEWNALAMLHGTRVLEIHARTEQATRFCQSFGVGGCLRWQTEDLSEDEGEVPGVEDEPVLSNVSGLQGTQSPSCVHAAPLQSAHEKLAVAAQELDRDSISTVDTAGVEDHRSETLAWFQAELMDVLGDPSAAEALTACVEIVLSDELTPRDEIMESVIGIVSSEG